MDIVNLDFQSRIFWNLSSKKPKAQVKTHKLWFGDTPPSVTLVAPKLNLQESGNAFIKKQMQTILDLYYSTATFLLSTYATEFIQRMSRVTGAAKRLNEQDSISLLKARIKFVHKRFFAPARRPVMWDGYHRRARRIYERR